MALISELVTKLKVDSREFKSKINEASMSVESFSSKFLKFGGIAAAAIGITAVGAFGLLLHSINETTERIDEMANTASKFGTTVEAVQKLSYAANLADVSSESLNGSMKKLVGSLNQLDAGGKNATAAFAKLNLTQNDLKGLGLDQVYGLVAERIRALPTALEQAKAATAIFGRNGVEVLNLLKSDIKEAGAEFEKFGGIISESGAKGVSDYDDATKKLSALLDAFSIQLTVAVAPALTAITQYIQEQIVSFGGLGNVAKLVAVGMIDVFIGIAQGIKGVIILVDTLIKSFQTLKLAALQSRQNFNNLGVASGVSDLDFNRLDEIARLQKSTTTPSGSGVDKVIGGLRAARNQINTANESSKQTLDITVNTSKGFELSIAGSAAVSAAIRSSILSVTADERRATRA